MHVNEVKEIWKFVNYISSELPDPVFLKNNLYRLLAGMKHDLERIKAKLGNDISDIDEEKNDINFGFESKVASSLHSSQ